MSGPVAVSNLGRYMDEAQTLQPAPSCDETHLLEQGVLGAVTAFLLVVLEVLRRVNRRVEVVRTRVNRVEDSLRPSARARREEDETPRERPRRSE